MNVEKMPDLSRCALKSTIAPVHQRAAPVTGHKSRKKGDWKVRIAFFFMLQRGFQITSVAPASCPMARDSMKR
ncbi:MAG: hypothetical protein RI973_1575 [Bacteroidota bacterium]|jgi:hypothetical protein